MSDLAPGQTFVSQASPNKIKLASIIFKRTYLKIPQNVTVESHDQVLTRRRKAEIGIILLQEDFANLERGTSLGGSRHILLKAEGKEVPSRRCRQQACRQVFWTARQSSHRPINYP